jgi:integrase
MEQLYDMRGQRKYLTQHERDRFLKAARSTDTPVRAFCEVLAYTGCRLSESLALTPERVDPAAGFVVFESLKKRRRGVFRAVPVPPGLLETLARLQRRNARDGLTSKLWSWSRTTAWRRVREVMRAAEVSGAAATPKGLRHAFGTFALAAAVPLTMIQKWMGHADIATTAIYLDVSGDAERLIAIRMWQEVLRPEPLIARIW